MSKLLRGIFVFIWILMLTGSALMFYEDIKILFLRESAEYLSDISEINIPLSISFLITFFAFLIFAWKRLNILNTIILCLIFALWLISGRTVAFKYFPDGRVITGWYYIETDMFKLCIDALDYETIISSKTTVKRLPFWRVNLENKNVDKIIFIGPFTWESSIDVFENKIGKYYEK